MAWYGVAETTPSVHGDMGYLAPNIGSHVVTATMTTSSISVFQALHIGLKPPLACSVWIAAAPGIPPLCYPAVASRL